MPIELTVLGALFIASAFYLIRLAILTGKAEDDEYLEDLEDRVGAIETLAEDLEKAAALVKDLKLSIAAVDEKVEILDKATVQANKGIITKLNAHELRLAQVPRGKSA